MPVSTTNYESLFLLLLRTECFCQVGLKLGNKLKSYWEKQMCNYTTA